MTVLVGMLLALLNLQEVDHTAPPTLEMTSDPIATGRCLNGMAGFTGVRMQCVVDAQGRGRDCVVANPNPRIVRYERVFQCMAATMRFSMSNRSSPEGEMVEFGLSGKTVLGEEELRQSRNPTRKP